MKRVPIIVLAALAGFFALGDRYAISVMYTQFMTNYGISSKVIFSILFSSFYIGYTIMQIPGGKLSERFGPARISGISLVLWSIFLLLLTEERSFGEAVVLAFLMGLSQGPIFPSIMFLVRLHYDDEEYGKATGYVSFLADMSPAVVPFVAFSLFKLEPVLIFPIAIFVVAGIITGTILTFLKTEFKKIEQKARWSILRNPNLWIFGVTFFLYDFLFYVFLTWYPSFLVDRYGIEQGNFVFYSAPWILMGFTAIISGYILDRAKRDAVITVASYFVLFFSMISIAFFHNQYIFLIMVTVILSLLNPILLSSWRYSTRLAGKDSSALVGGWMNSWGNLGGIAAPFATASIASLVGLNSMFLYFSFLSLIAGILWILLKVRPYEKS
ncbi:MAG: MFS transporter [Candidatus Thermoplasmatota archaeon]|jgi:ACS family glucarate transporter-like MFS transporter|nr:MFS transporter [Candidatus Thermoplasmatota archaeon]